MSWSWEDRPPEVRRADADRRLAAEVRECAVRLTEAITRASRAGLRSDVGTFSEVAGETRSVRARVWREG